jgi:nitroreductase
MSGPKKSEMFRELIQSRRSVREYEEDKEIEQEVLDSILDDCKWAPSWCNTHPYVICIARGSKVDRIKAKLCANFDSISEATATGDMSKIVKPNGDYRTNIKYDSELQKRRVDCAKGLYDLVGIERNDKIARTAQDRRNLECFDCTTVAFIFVQGDMGPFSPLDAGICLDTLLLSAHAHGIGACAQGVLATWGVPIREEFNVPDGYKLLCGVSMGYEKKEALINKYKPARQPVDVLY